MINRDPDDKLSEAQVRTAHRAIRECDCGYWNAAESKLRWPHPKCKYYRCAAMVAGLGQRKPWEDE